MNDRRADPLVMLVGDDEMKRVWGGSKDCWSRKLSDGSRVDRMFTGSIAHIWEGRHCRYAFRDNLASARLVRRTADADPGCPQRASWGKDRAGPSNYHAPREERTLIEQESLGPISQRKYIEFAGNIRSAEQRALSVFFDVQTTVELEAGRCQLKLETVDLCEVAKATGAEFLQTESGADREVISGTDGARLLCTPSHERSSRWF